MAAPTNPFTTPRRLAYVSLSELLSNTNLNYDDFTKGFIIRHVVDSVEQYQTLQYRIASVKKENDDDKFETLLEVYADLFNYDVHSVFHSYSIRIFFLEGYPRTKPHVWVNCPDNAIIINGINYIDTCGEVRTDYLNIWNSQSSNVLNFLNDFTQSVQNHTPFMILKCDHQKTKLIKFLLDNGQTDFYTYLYDKGCVGFILDKVIEQYGIDDLAESLDRKQKRVESFIKRSIKIAKKLLDYPCDIIEIRPKRSFAVPQQTLQDITSEAAKRKIKDLLDIPEVRKRYGAGVGRIRIQMNTLACRYPQTNIQYRFENSQLYLWVRIPYSLRGREYSFFVNITLYDTYPDFAPLVFVDPNANHLLAPSLPHIYPNGLVIIPYQENWNRRSNLAGLVSHLSAEFTCLNPLVKII